VSWGDREQAYELPTEASDLYLEIAVPKHLQPAGGVAGGAWGLLVPVQLESQA